MFLYNLCVTSLAGGEPTSNKKMTDKRIREIIEEAEYGEHVTADMAVLTEDELRRAYELVPEFHDFVDEMNENIEACAAENGCDAEKCANEERPFSTPEVVAVGKRLIESGLLFRNGR